MTRVYVQLSGWLEDAKRRLRESEGATGVEYAILVAIIALAALAGALLLGPIIRGVLQNIANSLGG